MNLQNIRNRIGASAICLSAASFTCSRIDAQEQSASEAVARSIPGDSTVGPQSSYRTAVDGLKDLSFPPLRIAQLPPIKADSTEQLAKPKDESLPKSFFSKVLAVIPFFSKPLAVISFALCAIGFVVYGRAAVPVKNRANHMLSRVGEIFDRDPGFYPANLSSIKMWAVNNFALAATSISMGISIGQFSLGSIYPAAVCALSLAIFPLSKMYSSKAETNFYMKTCERLSYLAIGLHILTHCFGATTTSTLVVSAAAALAGRILSWVPLLTEMIKEGSAPSARNSFPSLTSVTYWTAGTTLAALSVLATYGTFKTSAAIIPLGYMFQNLFFLGIGRVSYLCWKKKMDAINTVPE